MRAIIFSLFTILFFNSSIAQKPQEKEKLRALESELNAYREQILNAETDSLRVIANQEFKSTLEDALNIKGSFEYDFRGIRKIGNLTSPDKAFKMITWNLPFDDGTHIYYCYIQIKKKKGENIVYNLTDQSDKIDNPEYKSLDYENWYGALYYEIIEIKRGRRTYYTLLGWDGDTELTNSKVIDILYFSGGKFKPKFGAPLFKRPGKTAKRVVFKYAEEAVMSMQFQPKQKRIVFDHLSPTKPLMEGKYELYGPDFSYDAYEFRDGRWVYLPDVDYRGGRVPVNRPPE